MTTHHAPTPFVVSSPPSNTTTKRVVGLPPFLQHICTATAAAATGSAFPFYHAVPSTFILPRVEVV
jgi:hypothetical protein